MHGRWTARFAAALALSAVALAVFAPASPASTREPLRAALSAARHPARAFESAVSPHPAMLRAMVHRSARRYASAASELQISSDRYGPAEVDSVAGVLRSLDHGPELAELKVFVASPEEIRETCGATVVACYVPSEDEMVVSGVDHPVAGVPRDFAIAHEYGHHLANTREGGALPAIEAGPVRWATYERVCQLARRGRLFPGNQGAHYWEDPEEAFAQSYAHLSLPAARVSWQYTPLLRPTAASLAKIHADVAHPVRSPVESTWRGSLGVGAGKPLGSPSVDFRLIRTPLDGRVSVGLQATPGARLVATLRDPAGGRPLARVATDPSGAADLSYSNCGHAALRLELRAASGPANFQAELSRP